MQCKSRNRTLTTTTFILHVHFSYTVAVLGCTYVHGSSSFSVHSVMEQHVVSRCYMVFFITNNINIDNKYYYYFMLLMMQIMYSLVTDSVHQSNGSGQLIVKYSR